MSKIILLLLWFCITTLCDWLTKHTPLSQPMGIQTKTNCVFAARVFPALGASYMHLLPFLIGSLCCLHLLRLVRVTTLVWFYDTQLETALSCFVLIFVSYATWSHFFSVHYPQNRCKIWRGLLARHDVTLTVLNSRGGQIRDKFEPREMHMMEARMPSFLSHFVFVLCYVLKFSIVFDIWTSTIVECFQVSGSLFFGPFCCTKCYFQEPNHIN